MITRKTTIKQKNPGWAEKRLKEALNNARYRCKAGLPSGKGVDKPSYTTKSASGKETAGPSILEVAIWNNYGVPGHIPARPFMEQATPEIKEAWRAMQAQLSSQAKRSGKTVDAKAALKLAGQMAQGIIQKVIGSGDFQANAPSTVRKKGSSKPLMDTGALKGHITYAVGEEDEE